MFLLSCSFCQSGVLGVLDHVCLHAISDRGSWVPCFTRAINDWKLELVERFLLILQGKRLCSNVEDKEILAGKKDGKFTFRPLI